jgi:glycosyltransferase involved in cell wall biosynthesis
MLANRLLLERRDRVVAVGKSVRRALIDNEGIPARHVKVIYNGIPLDPFMRGAPDRGELRQEMQVGPHDFVVMQVARLDPLKDHPAALQVLERMLQRRHDARLVFVGEGPEFHSLLEMVRRRSLEPYVRFLGLRNDVPRLLAAADACILTSVSEGIPLTLIEGMAAGLPVVATDVGGVPEVVADGQTGFLTPRGDHAAFCDRLLQLADSPALRMEMGRLGRERALRMFSESQMHAAYQRLYEEMLLGRRHLRETANLARLR